MQESYDDVNFSTSLSSASSKNNSLNNKPLSWVKVKKFTDLELADEFVLNTSTRDSTTPVCVFFDKLAVKKHKMLQQTRKCKSKLCKQSEKRCDYKYKYQKCKVCKIAVVWKSGDHPVEQTKEIERRGIGERVKRVIEAYIKKSVCELRPVDIFIFLNSDKTKDGEMKGLAQPTLAQIYTFLKKYRELNSTLNFNIHVKETRFVFIFNLINRTILLLF